ncbi:MAG: hypothetical protein NC906_03650 [Candidatus Omnitrophica bacterium]|nr:hypothetical protein [Candidatus Omnitrophota bacterium]MCM8817382.1 hypothetical protein [Candidatus Omnitrophota bacterium]
MKRFLFLILFLFIVFCYGSSQIDIEFEYPSISGDFYVAGTVFFPPSAVSTSDNIIVMDTETKSEIQSKITVQENWPDGSILSAEIIFPANRQKRTRYAIFYGEDVKRKKSFSESAVLPTVSFITPGAGKTIEDIDISVGEINVRVDRSASIRYWWYIIPAFILIFLTILRTLRTIRTQKT